MNFRPEAEVDSNKISTRTHNLGLDLAPQCRESAIYAGGGSLRGASSAWPVETDRTCIFIFGRNETAPETDILVLAENENENVTASVVSAENENEIECIV